MRWPKHSALKMGSVRWVLYIGSTYNLTVLGSGSTYQYHFTMKYIFTTTLPTYLVTFPPLGQFELLYPPLIWLRGEKGLTNCVGILERCVQKQKHFHLELTMKISTSSSLLILFQLNWWPHTPGGVKGTSYWVLWQVYAYICLVSIWPLTSLLSAKLDGWRMAWKKIVE